jgi:HSP20 family molecular chaperone IbpA
VANGKSGTMNDESGTMIDYAKVAKNTKISVENSQLNNESGTMNGESGTMNGESGTMILEKAKLYDIQSQDDAVFAVVADSPGIKKDQIFLRVQTSIRSVQRTLDRLAKANKIEYRGSKQKGGWFVKT